MFSFTFHALVEHLPERIVPQFYPCMQERMQAELKDKCVAVSGAGNVAQFAVEKLLHLGAIPVTISDGHGTLYEPDGITIEQLSQMMSLKSCHKKLADLSPSPTSASAQLKHPPKPREPICLNLLCKASLRLTVDKSDLHRERHMFAKAGIALRICSVVNAVGLKSVTPTHHAGRYVSGAKPWKVIDKVQIALPCTTQN